MKRQREPIEYEPVAKTVSDQFRGVTARFSRVKRSGSYWVCHWIDVVEGKVTAEWESVWDIFPSAETRHIDQGRYTQDKADGVRRDE